MIAFGLGASLYSKKARNCSYALIAEPDLGYAINFAFSSLFIIAITNLND